MTAPAGRRLPAIDPRRHAGRTAIVTGAASGIGRATAARLAREGARVFGCNTDEASRDTARDWFAARSLDVTLLRADITDQGEVDALVAAAGDRIDLLANVAGTMDGYRTLADIDDATWSRVLEVNLTGTMRISRAVLPVMTAAGGGSVVMVASRAAVAGGPAGIAYTATKHAVLGLVRSIAWFHGPQGIRANAVLPGGVHSEMHTSSRRSGWAFERAAVAKAAMPDKADPDEVAAAVSWIGSAEASYVNGAVLAVDGGWSSA